MNVWIAASLVLAVGFVPCILVCLRSDVGSSVAAVTVAGTISVVMLVTMDIGFRRPPLIDLAVVMAPMALIGSLAFVRFLERRR
jgi:multisubunit Na+/H+ antiporter MnhF subunit